MKIILSRKGFDSSYGGGASPIMPNGDLLSIPIPASDKKPEKGIPYAALKYGKQSYLDLMKTLGLKIPENRLCHFDPDLISAAYQREENWQGIFGQQGAALTHLKNYQVTKGDIFLFFGSFKRTIQKKKLVFDKDYQRHIIFGYLIVDQIIDPKDDLSNKTFAYHSHFKNKDLYSPRNLVYIAANHQGFGGFKYRRELVLTKAGFPKSVWELPLFFHPQYGTTISRHSERDFEIRGDKTILQSRGIGQDFVIENNEQVMDWAKSIIDYSERIVPVS